jgi:hypothetical protein
MLVTYPLMDHEAAFSANKFTRLNIHYLLAIATVGTDYYIIRRLEHIIVIARCIRYNIDRGTFEKLIVEEYQVVIHCRPKFSGIEIKIKLPFMSTVI